MALEDTNLPLSFVQGEDTKTDPKQVVLGKVLSLENSTLISPKQIKKRPGNVALSKVLEGGGSISAGVGLAAFQSELELMDGTNLNTYNAEDQKWVIKGPLQSVGVSQVPIFRGKYSEQASGIAYHSNGLYLYTTTSGPNATRRGIYSIVDATTGEFLVSNVTVSDSAGLSCITLGNYFILTYYSLAVVNTINYIAIPVTTPLVPNAPVAITATAGVVPAGFGMNTLGSTTLYFAWLSNAGALSMRSLDSTLTFSGVTSVAAEQPLNISVFCDTVLSQVWISYRRTFSNDLVYTVRNSALGSVVAPTVLEVATVSLRDISIIASNGSGNIFWTRSDPGGDLRYSMVRQVTANNAGGGIVASVFMRSVQVTVAPFFNGTDIYLGVTYIGYGAGVSGVSPQSTGFIVSINKISNKVPKVIAKIAPSVTPGSFPAQIVSPSSGVFVFPVTIINELFTGNFAGGPASVYYTTGVASYTITFTSANNYLRCVYGNNLLVSGGYITMYDGQQVVEHNFHVFPEVITSDFTPANAGGSIADGHNYGYIMTYEWMDAYGQLHQSNTSIPAIVTVPANGGANTSQVTAVVPTLRVTSKSLSTTQIQSPVLCVLYRTQKDSSGPYYRCKQVSVLTISDPTVDTVTIVDTVSDATLITQGQLYITGGVVSNAAAPATVLLTTYKQRVLALSAENRNQFYFSEQVVPNSPVTFSDSLTWNVDTYGGDVVAFNQMDDKLILLKEFDIFYMVGDGPSNTGSQNDFTTPQIVPSDGGCTNPRSVCLTPFGLIYQSEKGWYLLDRSLSSKYVGADVEAYNSRTVLQTILVPNTTQVRIFLDSGTILTYDYYLNQWHHGTGQTSVDTCLFQDKICFLNASGLVQQQSNSVFTDNGNFVNMAVQTSWIQMANLQGFQRVREMLVLGQYRSAHNLVVDICYDFDPTIAQTVTIPVTSPVVPYQFRIYFNRQKCEAFQITVRDTQNGAAGTGEGFWLSGLTFNFGVKKGFNKVSAAKSFS